MNAIKDWWNQSSPRDQMALFMLATAVVVYILYAIVQGAHGKYVEQIEANKRVSVSLDRVRELSTKLIARNTPSGGGRSVSIVENVNRTLREHSLKLSSMQPQSSGAVRLRMEYVPYSSLVAWLHQMEVEQGLKIKDSTITTSSEKGFVSITVTLRN